MVEVALLLAVIACRLVPGSLLQQMAAGVLVSAVFSNRLMVLTYNTAGYAVPLIALGLMVAVIAADESPTGPDRVVGGLLALALLHHYPAGRWCCRSLGRGSCCDGIRWQRPGRFSWATPCS